MSTIETYKVFSKFYDFYVESFKDDLPLYNYYCDSTHNILEIGCGTGRVLKSLAENNCSVLGIDISDEMLDIARKKLKEYITAGIIKLEKYNIFESPIGDGFDRVLITFYTINYLMDNSNCKIFLKNVFDSMKHDGIILIDLFYPKPLHSPEKANIWKTKKYNFDNTEYIVRDKRKMKGNIETRIQEYIVNGKQEKIKTKRRFYTKQEIGNMLQNCGFVNIEFTDGYNYKKFHSFDIEEGITRSFVVKAEKRVRKGYYLPNMTIII